LVPVTAQQHRDTFINTGSYIVL